MTKTDIKRMKLDDLEEQCSLHELDSDDKTRAELIDLLIEHLFNVETVEIDKPEVDDEQEAPVELVRMFRWKDGEKQFANVHPGMVVEYAKGEYIEVE